jgi:hypothetical protein
MRNLANLLRFKKPWYPDRVQGFATGEAQKILKQ